jgi:DNA-binding LacI/PurR family transcriptional regulator
MANIYDVARRAKVSTATVSKVLSNTPYVSLETRQRVLEAVRELGYIPSLAARSLTGNRTFVIGLAIPYDPDYLFDDPFLLQIIRGVEEVANDRDYNLLFSTARQADPQSAYTRLLRSGYVDGVITLETFIGSEPSRKLEESGFARVTIGYPVQTAGDNRRVANAIHSDDYSGALEATRHLLALGHRRIAIINGPAHFMMAMEERLQGYRDGLAEYRLEIEPALMTNGDFTVESGYLAARTLLQLSPRPSAIFSFNDRMALGALRYARELGLNIPGDLSVVGFDDVVALAADPPLTTVHQSGVEMGKMAAQKLFGLINNEIEPFDQIILPIEFIIRGSTGPARAALQEQPSVVAQSQKPFSD